MTDKILFVDDDFNILASYKRQLNKRFRVDIALDGKEGLEAIRKRGPYAVVVSDLRMPGMDGIELFTRVRNTAPDIVRILLTGHADVNVAVHAINEGNIFRFLTKPCQPQVLTKAVQAGLRQHQLMHAEQELLQKTLNGSIKVLTEILGLLNPEACGRASRITRYVKEIALELGVRETWPYETAAMLSQIGCMVLPNESLEKIYHGRPLSVEETSLFEMHPAIAADLLAHIPRMQEVAQIVAYQQKRMDGSGPPEDSTSGAEIPLGARILKVVLDFDALLLAGHSNLEALNELGQRPGWYDPDVLAAMDEAIGMEDHYEIKEMPARALREKMVIAEDVLTRKGLLLISRGHEVGRPLIERLATVQQTSGIREPIRVFVPRARSA
jgi:response regulator RpfG family c-di-GMP phosphodiesterase